MKTKPVPWTRPVSKKGTTAAAVDVEIARNSAIRSGELAFLTRLTVRCDCSPWILVPWMVPRCHHRHIHRGPRRQQGSTSQRIRKSKTNRPRFDKIYTEVYVNGDVGADDPPRKYPKKLNLKTIGKERAIPPTDGRRRTPAKTIRRTRKKFQAASST